MRITECEINRWRETEVNQKERERERQADRQTERQTDRQTNRQTENIKKHKGGEKDTQLGIQIVENSHRKIFDLITLKVKGK
jgi:hypothetical protein